MNLQKIKCYLSNKNADLLIKNQYYLSQETIKNLIENLPIEYINKIDKKPKFDKSKAFKYEKKQFKEKINYLCNNHIINSKTYELLINIYLLF